MALPQYVSTTDERVIEAISRNDAAHADFVKRAIAWAKERGYDNARVFRFNGLSEIPRAEYVTGLPGKPDESVFGEWTIVKSGQSSPKKVNKTECATMNAIRYIPEPLPGLPIAAEHGASSYSSPYSFVVDGVAYAGYADVPSQWRFGAELGEQWVEILSSTWADALDKHRQHLAS